jgi:hypothetical protein
LGHRRTGAEIQTDGTGTQTYREKDNAKVHRWTGAGIQTTGTGTQTYREKDNDIDGEG